MFFGTEVSDEELSFIFGEVFSLPESYIVIGCNRYLDYSSVFLAVGYQLTKDYSIYVGLELTVSEPTIFIGIEYKSVFSGIYSNKNRSSYYFGLLVELYAY